MPENQLTRCELEVMDIVWERGHATVQEVCDSLPRELAYTTVMTTLKILEEKRRVLRKYKEGRAFVYVPTVTREEVCQRVANDLKKNLLRKSVSPLLLNLLEDSHVSDEELAELKAAIAKLEEQRP
ncbi:MAG: BlaI/MecI/CopY family transcriptional regulator [Planctomycetaceae bacterium]|nr:BlaI/MecI/CopY family transcriptional regulator [Planctomycetaceae bacterium]